MIEWGLRRGSGVVGKIKRRLRQTPGVRVEYAAVVDPKTLEPVVRIRGTVWILLAAWVGGVRLIDGCEVGSGARSKTWHRT